MTVPEIATHYYLASRRPFLSLSELSDDALADVLVDLDALAASGVSQRRFGPRYMALRRATEQRLRQAFVRRGGQPARSHPHYFVLGQSEWFRGLYGTNGAQIQVPLAEFPAEATSVTYPDSVVAMGLLPDFGISVEPQPYHGQVFLLDELDGLIDQYGLPDQASPAGFCGYQHRAEERFIEIQLWIDLPGMVQE